MEGNGKGAERERQTLRSLKSELRSRYVIELLRPGITPSMFMRIMAMQVKIVGIKVRRGARRAILMRLVRKSCEEIRRGL